MASRTRARVGWGPVLRTASRIRPIASTPIPRLITPDDVAYAVLFFAGDDAGVITGQNVYVGGGVELMMSGIV
jgi:3-oxoacyl-[acyl-carrier protein] reductase